MPSDSSALPTSSLQRAPDSSLPVSLPLEQVEVDGRADGEAARSGDAYESFLVQSVAEARLQEELEALQERLHNVEATIEAVQDRRRDLVDAKTTLEDLLSKRERTKDKIEDVETSLEAVEQEQAAKQRHGSTLYALLYTVAGAFFVAGDVIMSREIVANALKLRGDAEQWIFGIGLAMLAVLLKPAYDRLVERRYWAGHSDAFAVVISVCALGALGTLWVLGAFRSAAFASSSRIQQLTAKLTEASDPATIQQIQGQISALQQNLIDGPLAYWAFALSGVLFAVAGAVCLGIGLKHVRAAYHLRYRLYRAHRRYRTRYDALTDTLHALEERIPECRATLRRQRQALADTESLDALRDQRDRLRTQRRTLRDKRAEVRSRRLQALYRHGYDQAQQAPSPDATPTGDGAPSLASAATDPDDDASGDARDDAETGWSLHALLPRLPWT
jgi:predicted nuclease with TOPRIM domain